MLQVHVKRKKAEKVAVEVPVVTDAPKVQEPESEPEVPVATETPKAREHRAKSARLDTENTQLKAQIKRLNERVSSLQHELREANGMLELAKWFLQERVLK